MSTNTLGGEVLPTGFKANVMRCLRKYVDGNGRARRREYWWFVLFQLLVLFVPGVIGGTFAALAGEDQSSPLMIGAGLFFVVAGLAYLALILPSLTVLIRRFHDVGLSGWLILLNLIPYIGGIITFVITLLPSQAVANKHGPVPGQIAPSTADIFS